MTCIAITTELKQALKKLRLSGILDILPERISYANGNKLTCSEFLEIVLMDEVTRRNSTALIRKVKQSRLSPDETLERFDWDAKITISRAKIRELFTNHYLLQNEGVLFIGPAGVGKSFLANALGHVACRAGYSVETIRADQLFKLLWQSRADNSYEREMRRLIHTDLLIIDDFGLKPLSDIQATDFYELVVERYTKGSMIITSNRHIEEWAELFPDPILANSALDRLAHNAHQIVIEGESYRRRKRPEGVS